MDNMNEEETESEKWFFIESDRSFKSRRFRYKFTWIMISILVGLVSLSSVIMIFFADRKICGIIGGALLLLFCLFIFLGVHIMNPYPVRIRISKDCATLPFKENKLELFLRFASNKSVDHTGLRIVWVGATLKGEICCNFVYLHNEIILSSAIVILQEAELDQLLLDLKTASFPWTFVMK